MISVILPTFNSENTIEKCIESVLNQSYEHFELIIIDNCSSDKTTEIISKFQDERLKLLSISNNGVIAKSRNLGIANSKYDYICFIDSDDLWANKKLQFVYDHICEGYEFIFHDCYIVKDIDDLSNNKKFGYILNNKLMLHEHLLEKGNCIINSSVAVKKSLLRKVCPLNERKEISGCEDYFLWLEITKNTNRYAYIDECLGYYLDDGNNFSNPKRSKSNSLSIIRDVFNFKHIPNWLIYKYCIACFKLGKKDDLYYSLLPRYKLTFNFLSLKILFLRLYR